ncbi:YqzL family protein [Alteribacillus iranensis]|uniref:YqzL-like protein n=1 Tax=Alteribacillus iranensis TaxID=930128 RepID=A0A1I1ZCM4_9BACI|nr:YqzL family protein [Alteribacillus iranensis]SFE29068.1 YqzL-like protein [Alteribacillus iranensis]
MFQQPDAYWDYFFLTGNIDAYLISKQLEQHHQSENDQDISLEEDNW